MAQRRPPSKRSNATREPVTIRAARLSGRYSIIAAVVGAVLAVGLASWVASGGSHSQPAAAAGTGAAARGTVSAFAANSPARIEGMTPFKQPLGNSWATAKPVRLSASELVQLNASPGGSGPLPSSVDPVVFQAGLTEVTMVGNASGTVTINIITVVRQCSAPLSGTYFDNPGQGLDNTIRIGFDLDSIDPVAKYLSSNFGSTPDFFPAHVVTLAPGEAQTFAFYVTSEEHYCQFTFRVSVVTPNGTVTEAITDHGRPFRITGPAQSAHGLGAYGAIYLGGASAMAEGYNKTGNWVAGNPATVATPTG